MKTRRRINLKQIHKITRWLVVLPLALFAGQTFAATTVCPPLTPGQWRMLGLPQDVGTANTVNDQLSDDLGAANINNTWIAYERNEPSNIYSILNNNSVLDQQNAYWIKSLSASTIDIDGTATTLTGPGNVNCSDQVLGCFEVNLQAPSAAGGRLLNLVGNTFNNVIPWQDVRFVTDTGQVFRPSEAEANMPRLAAKTFSRYSGSAYQVFDDVTPGAIGELNPCDGFWVEVNDPSVIKLAIPSGPVDDSPLAVADSATVTEDDAATAVDVQSNDTDIDTTTANRIASVTQPADGTVTITNGGVDLSYQPNADFCNDGTPTDDFSYTLTPGGSSATVSVTVVCVDDPRVAMADALNLTEDASATRIDVLANDTDIDGNTATTIASVTQPANGSVAITNAGADLTYQPNANYCNDSAATDVFAYTLSPGGSMTTVSVAVSCVDDPPVAVADAGTVVEDSGANSINVLNNDTDVDAGPISISDVTQPPNGAVVITNAGADLTYQPNADYCNDGTATDDFTYTLTPGGASTIVQVSVSCVIDVDDVETTVSEAALTGGTGTLPPGVSDIAMGTLPFDDGLLTDVSVLSGPGSTGATKVIHATTVTLSSSIWEIEVDRTSGVYTYTLLEAIDHPVAGIDTLPLTFSYTVTNTADSATGSLLVNIIDDVPQAVSFNKTAMPAGDVNLAIVFDRSGSTREDPGVPGFAQRIDLVRAALRELVQTLDAVGELNIKVFQFNTRASSTDWFTGPTAAQQALDFLSSLRPAGGTSYRAAIDEVLDEYGTPPGLQSDGFRNLLYFLPDGNPNPGRELTATQISDYRQFVVTNNIMSYAVSVSDGVTPTNPSFVAIGIPAIADGPLQNPVVVLDEATLPAVLKQKAGTVQGNVLTEANAQSQTTSFGADGGLFETVTVGASVFEYDSDMDQILRDDVFFEAGSRLTVMTNLGSELQFDFSNGDYAYTGPAVLPVVRTETIIYTLLDADGDISNGNLIFTVTPL